MIRRARAPKSDKELEPIRRNIEELAETVDKLADQVIAMTSAIGTVHKELLALRKSIVQVPGAMKNRSPWKTGDQVVYKGSGTGWMNQFRDLQGTVVAVDPIAKKCTVSFQRDDTFVGKTEQISFFWNVLKPVAKPEPETEEDDMSVTIDETWSQD